MPRLLTQLLKRDNSYASIFSSALKEGIIETFEEMGYSCDKMDEKGNNKIKRGTAIQEMMTIENVQKEICKPDILKKR